MLEVTAILATPLLATSLIFAGLGELLAERTREINLCVGHDAGRCNFRICTVLVQFDLSVFSVLWGGAGEGMLMTLVFVF